tara:strand:+ start:819 stop:1445 length:627 start_codon:yes stop_codon:yes gene_type:complete
MLEEIFKVGLYSVDLNINTNQIKDYLIEYSKQNEGRNYSNASGGYQSKSLYNEDIIDTPLEQILPHINLHSKKYNHTVSHKGPIVLDNLWFNINYHRDYNAEHMHQHALYNGVLYIDVPEDSGEIVFLNPAYDVMQYDWYNDKVKEWTELNSHVWVKRPMNGSLYIFPSWLKHKVTVNNNSNPRISIAFNYVSKNIQNIDTIKHDRNL